MGPLKKGLVENISLQRCNCNIFGLADTMALFAKEAGFYRFWVFFRASSLQNEVGDPRFFYISDITNSSSFNGKISRKKSMLEKFGANVLKVFSPGNPPNSCNLKPLTHPCQELSKTLEAGMECRNTSSLFHTVAK